MKINWQKGFWRMALSLSIVLPVTIGVFNQSDYYLEILIFSFVFVWVVYFAGKFVAKGFLKG